MARPDVLVRILAAAAFGAACLAVVIGSPPPGPPPRPAELSIFALGDTGMAPGLIDLFDGQLSVARTLMETDRVSQTDALLLLGDLFYPSGLRSSEIAPRIRANLVRPYCRFMDLSGPRSAEVADACPLSAQTRRHVPIFAVLGNHDYGSPESVYLEREVLPLYVANWRMPRELAEAVELGHGVSLVLYDSQALYQGADPAPLREALRRARGPWRLLAAHHPIDASPGARAIREVIAAAGVPVHLHLAGHEHNLQIGQLDPPGPALQLVSGGGAEAREPQRELPGRRFLAVSHGFARVDLVAGAEGEQLLISLIEAAPIQFWKRGRVLTTWSIDRTGRAQEQRAGAEPTRSRAERDVFPQVAPALGSARR